MRWSGGELGSNDWPLGVAALQREQDPMAKEKIAGLSAASRAGSAATHVCILGR